MYALLFCILTVNLCFLSVNSQKVPVTVYYESLCPDSRKFFTSQLYPTLQTNLSKWVNLTLVPYGKSNHTHLAADEWQFVCHHGPFECQGNKIQACALQEIEKSTPTPSNYSFNPVTLAFINCLMDKSEKSIDSETGAEIYEVPIKNCSEINHVQDYVNIENCAQHSVGSKYLADLGDATHTFQDNLKSVPTIVFAGKFKMEESREAESNFVKVLCRYITDKPEECKSCAVAFTTSGILFLLTFLKLLF